MKRIAALLAVLTLTAVAGSALADAPVNCSPTNASTCGCTAAPAAQAPRTTSDLLKMSEQYLP